MLISTVAYSVAFQLIAQPPMVKVYHLRDLFFIKVTSIIRMNISNNSISITFQVQTNVNRTSSNISKIH